MTALLFWLSFCLLLALPIFFTSSVCLALLMSSSLFFLTELGSWHQYAAQHSEVHAHHVHSVFVLTFILSPQLLQALPARWSPQSEASPHSSDGNNDSSQLLTECCIVGGLFWWNAGSVFSVALQSESSPQSLGGNDDSSQLLCLGATA